MKLRVVWLVVFVALVGLNFNLAIAQETQTKFQPDAGFESLFNGKDLTGWNYLPTTEQQKKQHARWKKSQPNDAPPWPFYDSVIDFAGKSKSDDGRFVAENGTIAVTVPLEGRKIQMLYTKKVFTEDFTLRLQFKAANGADSGVFIKGKQLQCRDYPNAGPYKKLKNFNSEDWNDLVVVAKGKTAYCTCNGEVLEAEMKIPESGPIGFEGDRGRLEYRNIQIGPAPTDQFKPTNKASSWTFETHANGKGTMKEDGDAITFSTTQTGEENWHVQALQTKLDLEDMAKYTVSFEIKSPDSVQVNLVAQIGKPDWHQIGLYEEIQTGPEYAAKSLSFTVGGQAKYHNRFAFILGESEGSVSIKNLKLTKLSEKK